MCGIAGLLVSAARGTTELQRSTQAMNDAIAYRGPDDQGIWCDAEAGIGLAHRQLSIVDLSPAGHQPMISAEGRFVMTYNGEVYNHQMLRAELEARGIKFRGHSDSEVMLEAFGAFGIEATVKRLVGMFAIGVWDCRDRTLTLIRDRLGIKPIYWAKLGGLFLFGSELKALRACPGWTPRINRGAVASFMRHNYIPAPHSIYEGVHKLEPGSILTLPWGGEPRVARYWDAREIARNGLASPLDTGDVEATDRLETLLNEAVSCRMIADVPLGAFLSGGVDSSTVVALMQATNTGRVKTFTIGFDIPGYDESAHAAAVAKHLGTQHTELMVDAQSARDVIPKLPEMFDEPFADSSQIPTHLVSAMTRHHVTVALSGDGGDELFGGYNRYHLANNAWRRLSMLPRPLRDAMARGITAVSPQRWSNLLSGLPGAPAHIGDKLHKVASILGLRDPDALYLRLVTHWDPAAIVPEATEPRGILFDERVAAEIPDQLSRMQFIDLVTYLPDDILTKVDRASMAVALEARVPLIDHRVVEHAWRLPNRMKIRNGVSKWLLRQVLYRHVPPSIIERPKMGFGIPLGEWLRGPLREWAENLLSESRLREAGLISAPVVRRYWSEHLSGVRNWEYLMWDALMLQAWHERWA